MERTAAVTLRRPRFPASWRATHLEIMADRNPAEPVVEEVGNGILADGIGDVVVSRQPVEARRKRRIPEVGRTGVVDHEIKRAAMVTTFPIPGWRAGSGMCAMAERRCELGRNRSAAAVRPAQQALAEARLRQRPTRPARYGAAGSAPARPAMPAKASDAESNRQLDRRRGFCRRCEQLGCGQQEGDHQIAPELHAATAKRTRLRSDVRTARRCGTPAAATDRICRSRWR